MASKILVIIAGTLLLVAGSIYIFWDQLPFRMIWPYIAQPKLPIAGHVEQVTFNGNTAGEQTIFVYLPAGYKAGDQSYRVLYHLHGAFVRESWAEYDCNKIGESIERAAADKIIDPMIVVCPHDPDGNRMWADSFDGQYLASSGLILDVIPYVEQKYRTIVGSHGRALQGFSMGGFGAAVNGFKHHDLFSAIIIWDGALHDWNTLSTNRASIANKMFDNESYFTEWSPYEWATAKADADIDLFMVVGTMTATRDFASRFRPHVESTGREFVYHESSCPHDIFCMNDELGNEAFAFLADSFAK